MFSAIRHWLPRKWRDDRTEKQIAFSMAILFGSPAGRVVLEYWLDTVYCTVCSSSDPIQLAAHNANRAFVHDILQKIDEHNHPEKYVEPPTEVVEHDARAA